MLASLLMWEIVAGYLYFVKGIIVFRFSLKFVRRKQADAECRYPSRGRILAILVDSSPKGESLSGIWRKEIACPDGQARRPRPPIARCPLHQNIES